MCHLFIGRPGTEPYMTELLNELLTRTCSDEGTVIGAVSVVEWDDARSEYVAWSYRPN